MESTTVFLAQLWGPAIIAVGLGVFISKDFYAKLYRDIEKEPMALLVFGFAGIATAIAHIQAHNIWGSLPEILISFFGWALLIKAAIFLVKPDIADNWGNMVSKEKMVPIAGGIALALGAYLSWIGYMM